MFTQAEIYVSDDWNDDATVNKKSQPNVSLIFDRDEGTLGYSSEEPNTINALQQYFLLQIVFKRQIIESK